ncbi:MAG: alpha/beta hydrolase [Eubacterium sp.]|nr:alpha/beta hydrolase [Eubacterium sp.]
MSENIKTGTVSTDSFTLDYVKFGHGKNVFVILPGISVLSVMNFADAVADAYKVLTDDYTVYLCENRIQLTSTASIQEMAEDTSAAFKAMGFDKVTLMGASYGGMTSMLIAAEHPDQIENLILCGTSAYVSDECYHMFDKWIGLTDAGNAEELYLDFGKTVYPAEIFEQSRDVLADMAKSVTEEDLKRFRLYLESIRGFDVRDRLKEIQCPVFIASSSDDKVFGEEGPLTIAKGLAACPDLRTKMYDGYGHAVYDTAPDLKERILRFLKREPEPGE